MGSCPHWTFVSVSPRGEAIGKLSKSDEFSAASPHIFIFADDDLAALVGDSVSVRNPAQVARPARGFRFGMIGSMNLVRNSGRRDKYHKILWKGRY